MPRPKGAKNKSTLARLAREELVAELVSVSEPIFPEELPRAVSAAMQRCIARAELAAADVASAESIAADRTLIGLLHAPPKPKEPPITFQLPEGTLEVQARGILAAVARGQITVADGKQLLGSVRDAAMVGQALLPDALVELRNRIEELERAKRPSLRSV